MTDKLHEVTMPLYGKVKSDDLNISLADEAGKK